MSKCKPKKVLIYPHHNYVSSQLSNGIFIQHSRPLNVPLSTRTILLSSLLLYQLIGFTQLSLAQLDNGQYIYDHLNNQDARLTTLLPITNSGQQPNNGSCCPCDEAKYELVFEGLWSKYTHPDEFPENETIASFGDIIGASHSHEFRMWDQGSMASEGVKELAETGSTKRLESELKLASSKTRTIIKARELRYPTLLSKTSAVFRTDRHNHLVSILSKLSPSPDWMVGVSGLDLCQADCTWSSERSINLFPWDAGIDSGVNFSVKVENNPSIPQEPIKPYRRTTNSNSNNQLGVIRERLGAANMMMQNNGNKRSSSWPTINNNNNMMQLSSSGYSDQQQTTTVSVLSDSDLSFSLDQSKPFARLTITRQRIYEKSCNHSDTTSQQHHSQTTPINIMEHNPAYPWQSQTTTSANNGNGALQNKPNNRESVSDCRYTNWSDWTSCSSSCGKGIRTRTRSFKNDRYAQTGGCSISGLVEKEICLAECRGNSTCYTRDWGPWSRCSVDCGQGRRKRTRAIIGPHSSACDNVDLVDEEPCIGMGDCSGGPGHLSRQHQNQDSNNNHHGSSGASQDDEGNAISCEVSSWSSWTECSRHPCGGTRIRTRQYLNRDSVGRCKIQLIQKRQCPVNNELCRPNNSDTLAKCTMAPSEGPCLGSFIRWYYEATKQACMPFTFGGCGANENNFDTLQDCERSCFRPMRKL